MGLLPRLGRGAVALGWWIIRHPQPVLAAVLLVVAGWGVMRYVRRAEAFRITRVVLPSGSSLELHEPVVGQNLWALDIRALAQSLHGQQPWLKGVRVVRELPQTIRIDAIERRPVAQIHVRRWHPVDAEGFILPQGSPEPFAQLTRVTGLKPSRDPLEVGEVNTIPRLAVALRVLDVLQRHPALASRRVTEVNVDVPQQLKFVVDGVTEVRCGSEEALDGQLDRLRRALKVIAKQGMDVRYVDVRFKEPVIGPRT